MLVVEHRHSHSLLWSVTQPAYPFPIKTAKVFLEEDHLMPGLCQWLQNRNIPFTRSCTTKQFGNLKVRGVRLCLLPKTNAQKPPSKQGHMQKSLPHPRCQKKMLPCPYVSMCFRNAAKSWRIGNPWRKITYNHWINGCHATQMCKDIGKIQFCHWDWDTAT